MTTKDELKSLLLEILTESLNGGSQELGFVDRLQAVRYVFVNRTKPDCLWYEWDNDAKVHLPIHQKFIQGRLTEVATRETEFKGKPSVKVIFTFDCGNAGIIKLESARDTVFTRNVLLALWQMPMERLEQNLGIMVKEGDDDKVILPEIYSSGIRVQIDFNLSIETADLIDAVQQKLNGSSEDETNDDTEF